MQSNNHRGGFGRSGYRGRGRNDRSNRGRSSRFSGNGGRQLRQNDRNDRNPSNRDGASLQLCYHYILNNCTRDNCGFSHAVQQNCSTRSNYKSCTTVEYDGQPCILAANDNGVFSWDGSNNNRLDCPLQFNGFIVRQIAVYRDIIIAAGAGQVPLFPSIDVGRIILSNGNEATLSVDEPYAHQAKIEVMITSCFDNNFFVFTGGVEGDIHVWQLNGDNLSLSSRLTGHLRAVTGLQVAGNRCNLWSCSNDMTIRVWNLETNSCIFLLTQKDISEFHASHIMCLVRFCGLDGEGIMMSCDKDAVCQFWKEDDGSKHSGSRSEAAVSSVLTIDVSDDNAGLVILGLINGSIEIRGCDWALLGSFKAHNGAVLDLAIMNPSQLASAGEDGEVKLWNVDRNAFNQFYS